MSARLGWASAFALAVAVGCGSSKSAPGGQGAAVAEGDDPPPPPSADAGTSTADTGTSTADTGTSTADTGTPISPTDTGTSSAADTGTSTTAADTGTAPTADSMPAADSMPIAEDAGCALAASPATWTVHTLTDFSLATPATWVLFGYITDKPATDRPNIELTDGAVADESMRPSARVTEFTGQHSIESFLHLDAVVIAGKDGDSGCTQIVTSTKFGCDDAIYLAHSCPGRAPEPELHMVVLHDGVIYSTSCHFPNAADEALCKQVVASLRFAK